MSIVGNLSPVLFLTFCSLYGISYSLLGLLACTLTGFCVSMLWPGNLVVATEQFGMKAGMLVGMLFPLAAIQACLINGKKR